MNRTINNIRQILISPFSILFLLTGIGCTQKNKDLPPDDIDLKKLMQSVSDDNIFKTEGYYNWGSSTIKGEDGLYHLFYSRWKSEYKFTGWLLFSEIAHATSKSPSGPWQYKNTVLTGRGKGHWDAITAHNPKIKYFEGKYYLYYISSNLGDRADYTHEELLETSVTGYDHPNWKILRPNQRTGVAVSRSIDGPWKRFDRPLIEPSGPISTLTVNPAVAQGPDGRFYLIVKGDKPGATNFVRNQAIAVGTEPEGPFTMQPTPVIDYLDTEDMSIWYDDARKRFYGVFHSTEGFVGLVTSLDGINWDKAHGYEGITKKIPHVDGTEITPHRLERPFIYYENGNPLVLSLGANFGHTSYIVFVPLEKSKAVNER